MVLERGNTIPKDITPFCDIHGVQADAVWDSSDEEDEDDDQDMQELQDEVRDLLGGTEGMGVEVREMQDDLEMQRRYEEMADELGVEHMEVD